MTREQAEAQMRETLMELFDLKEEQLVPEARLEEDLDLDSIDAVDLVATMEKKIERRIDIEKFHFVETLGELMETIGKELITE